ncbi:MAG: tol-pal system-associated acyl-CoA thioesterase [Alphaproteobacteria bacterium]
MSNEKIYPSSGKIYQKLHNYPVRVFYEDTDAGGIVYYANYLKFAERARSELLRTLGFNNSRLFNSNGEQVAFAVKTCEIDYKQPARLDDALNVFTKVVEIKGASLTMEQNIFKDENLLVVFKVKLACIKLNDGKPSRLLDDVKSALEKLI